MNFGIKANSRVLQISVILLFSAVFLIGLRGVNAAIASDCTLYVSTSGNDSSAGNTLANAKLTPNGAANAAGPGDVVCIAPGTYSNNGGQSSVLNLNNQGGNAGNPITYKAYDDANKPVLAGSGYTSYAGCGIICVKNSDHIILENLAMTNAMKALGVLSSDTVSILGCKIDNLGQEGIHVGSGFPSTNVLIEGCDISGTGRRPGIDTSQNIAYAVFGELIYLGKGDGTDTSSNITIRNNFLHDNAGTSEAIDIKKGVSNILIENNHIENIDSWCEGAIRVQGGVSNVTISKNLIHGITASGFGGSGNACNNAIGIRINAGTISGTVSNNVVWDADQRGITDLGSSNVTFSNNTACNNGTDYVGSFNSSNVSCDSTGGTTQYSAANFVGPISGSANGACGHGSGYEIINYSNTGALLDFCQVGPQANPVASNSPPQITDFGSAAGHDLPKPENQTLTHDFSVADSDAGDTHTWSLVGGFDQAMFTINASTGLLTLPAQDFESPVDHNTNNLYQAIVRVTDSQGAFDEMTFAFEVTNLPCQSDPNDPDQSGCTSPDSDGDGVTDSSDNCPNTAAGVTVDGDGCHVGCTDTSANNLNANAQVNSGCTYDHYACVNNAPALTTSSATAPANNSTTYPTSASVPNCPAAPVDSDGDGVDDSTDPDDNDPCNPNDGLTAPFQSAPDSDSDSIRDDCDNQDNNDSDGDGVQNYQDQCPNTPAVDINNVDANGCTNADPCASGTSGTPDSDNDGVRDECDNAPSDPCDPSNTVSVCDSDNDGVPNGSDNCPNTAAGVTVDGDGCEVVNDPTVFWCDANDTSAKSGLLSTAPTPNYTTAALAISQDVDCDSDNDGVPNGSDNCPNTAAGVTVDGDGCEEESTQVSDTDGLDDTVENNAPNNGDINNDGVRDSLQNHVGSIVSPITNNYLGIVLSGDGSFSDIPSDDCNTIVDLQNIAENSLPVQDASHSYPLGLFYFKTSCQDEGDTVYVRFILDKDYSSDPVFPVADWIERKYLGELSESSIYEGHDSANYQSSYHNGSVVLNGAARTTIEVIATDGTTYDVDKSTNATITDPTGPAIEYVATTETDQQEAESEAIAEAGPTTVNEVAKLSKTGQSVALALAVGLGLILSSLILSKRKKVEVEPITIDLS